MQDDRNVAKAGTTGVSGVPRETGFDRYGSMVLGVVLAFLWIPVAGLLLLIFDGHPLITIFAIGMPMVSALLMRSWLALVIVPAAEITGGVLAVFVFDVLAQQSNEDNIAVLDAVGFALAFVIVATIMTLPLVALGAAAGRKSESRSGPGSAASGPRPARTAGVARPVAAPKPRSAQPARTPRSVQPVIPAADAAALVRTVGSGPRIGAALIDLMVLFLAFVVASPFIAAISGREAFGLWLVIAGLIAWIAYPTVMEAAFGATVGERVLGLRVVDEHGAPVSWPAAFVRTCLRIVDSLFFGIVGVILIETSPVKQRLGDRVAHTLVVQRKPAAGRAPATF